MLSVAAVAVVGLAVVSQLIGPANTVRTTGPDGN